MSWFQRVRDPAVTPRDPDPDAEKETLLNDLLLLRGYLNRHADRLPAESVVTAHQIGDVLRNVLDAAGNQALDAHTAVRLRGFLADYVPTTVRSFLAVSTDRESAGILQEQLESLLDEADGLAASVRSYDTDALRIQGTFLRTKFSRSDLDL